MTSAIVIIATTGAAVVRQAIHSCLNQTFPDLKVLAVVDGPEHHQAFAHHVTELDWSRFDALTLPENVGRDKFYGHRIYAGFSHLVNEDYVLFLDEDNFLERDHVARLVEKIERKNLDWAYSLRRICDGRGKFIVNDDCESLGWWRGVGGYRLIDTNCYCLKRDVAAKIASTWHGGWGQDRVVTTEIMQRFPQFGCSGAYTMNYRLTEGRLPKPEFFVEGAAGMKTIYTTGFPWVEP